MHKKYNKKTCNLFTIYENYAIMDTRLNITARGDNVIKKEMIAMLLAGGQGKPPGGFDPEGSKTCGIIRGKIPHY